MATSERKNRGFLGSDSSVLSSQDRLDRHQLRYELDLNSWNLRIWGVAASGFLTDSYNLFSTNVILTSVAFVYWPNGERWHGLLINFFTLLGSVCGQLLFGFLADYYGRTRLYGIELMLVIVSTVGVATSSHGYHDLSFLAMFACWRFVMGIGIGAEYPLSAVITAEWSSTKSRATMLSSVFMMQPIGQALAQLVGLWVLLGRENMYKLRDMQCGLNTAHEEDCKRVVDGIWRIVIGSGAIPALLAIIFRFFLFDCGLYSLEVKNKPGTALRNTQRVYGSPVGPGDPNNYAMQQHTPNGIHHSPQLHSPQLGMQHVQQTNSPRPMPVQFSKGDLYKYFILDGNWYYLLGMLPCNSNFSGDEAAGMILIVLGTSMTWFFLDVSFYGLSLDNRGTLSDMWATTTPTVIDETLPCWDSTIPGGRSNVPDWKKNGLPIWQTDSTQPCFTIYDVLLEQAKQYLLTVSIASIAGSACFVLFANRIRRKQWLTISFIILAVLFVITGCVYYGVNRRSAAPATIIFVAICHFMFNFGANTLTFIIPAEIFPTCYRCTCHGISAAAGKVGSIVALFLVYWINSSYSSDTKQGLIFLLFGSFVALGAIYSWAYLPDVQRWVVDDGHKYLQTRTLEDLGEGREKAKAAGEVITLKEKWAEFRRRRMVRRVRASDA